MRKTMGTDAPHRYRNFAALLTSWLKPVATKSLNWISTMGRSPASAAPTQTTIVDFFQERRQKEEGVAVLAADVLAVDEDARIAPQRVADAEHDGFEEGIAFRVERRRVFDLGQRARLRAAVLVVEHFDAHARRLAPQAALLDDSRGLELRGVRCDRIFARPEVVQRAVGIAAVGERRIRPRRLRIAS